MDFGGFPRPYIRGKAGKAGDGVTGQKENDGMGTALGVGVTGNVEVTQHGGVVTIAPDRSL